VSSDADRIPDERDWGGHEAEVDAHYAYGRMFGKSIDAVMCEFRDQTSEIFVELLQIPRRPFQYYVFAFVRILTSPGEGVGQSDCASAFLNLLCEREKRELGGVAQIYPELRETIAFVSANQAFFDAPVDIYGDFRVRAAEIQALCEAPHARR
jgi:hypothetical protein